MIDFRPSLPVAVLVSLLGLSACDRTQTSSGARDLTAQLAGTSEVPPTTSTGTGTLKATLNEATQVLSWTVTYSDLSGPLTAAHFHGPAMVGENAGAVVPITGDLASPMTGEKTLTAPQMTDLTTGKWYVNLHTAANPDGEIRGQVTINQR